MGSSNVVQTPLDFSYVGNSQRKSYLASWEITNGVGETRGTKGVNNSIPAPRQILEMVKLLGTE